MKLTRKDAALVSVTYDAQNNAIVISGGDEKQPATVQDIHDAATRGEIPASVAGGDIVLERGVMIMVGDGSHLELSGATVEWA